MNRKPVAIATSIFRNSLAQLPVGLLAKGMGLIIAVLIARFLGPAAMGVFAILFSVGYLAEFVAPLGLQDVLVRDVAARPSERIRLWKQATRLALFASLVPAAAFLVAAWMWREDSSIRNSLLTLAIGLPFSSMALVAQSVLQGMEKILYISWVTFLTRVVSLVALVWMFMQGMGVESAFISRVIFQVCSAALFIQTILRDPPVDDGANPAVIGFTKTLPFAVNRTVIETTMRAPLLLLPILFASAQIGIFDAADRFRAALGILVAVATTAIMPSFARSFAAQGDDRHKLVSYTAKYACLVMACAALGISIFADVIVRLLYGPKFADSAVLLQVLVWAQVLTAMDTVMKQAMIASGNEYAVVRRTLTGIACLGVLVLSLGYGFGLVGAAAGVLAAAAVTLFLDVHYVARAVIKIDIRHFIIVPLACVFLAGGVALALKDTSLLLRLAGSLATFAVAATATRLVPRVERSFVRDAVRHAIGK